MTIGTGKRLYRACERCRRRKTKCDLETVGPPNRPPCLDCYRTGNDCVLAGSRRGGNYGRRARSKHSSHAGPRPRRRPDDHCGNSSYSAVEGHVEGYASEDDLDQNKDQELTSELRNPSDALQILAQSKGHLENQHDNAKEASRHQMLDPSQIHVSEIDSQRASSRYWASKPAQLAVDDYELVERGLLSAGTVLELLSIYQKSYHAFFPLAPSHLFAPKALHSIRHEDFFLLTVLLTVGSRDREDFSLVHRYCWDYCQRLLLDVLLAQPWTQTPRTVEALLLLSEWLPHVPTRSMGQKNSRSSLSEDRTAWSLVGQAVRHAYLLKLDRAAFRAEGNTREPQSVRDHKRLIWTFVYLADRQISVRIGQSFWSRGPSPSSRFTADDFPTLLHSSPANKVGGVEEDFAQTHQANLELTQILHNAHDVLYSSAARTLALVFAGDYGRYIDDFQAAAAAWNSKWVNVPRSRPVKISLTLLYEYLGVYINAFSFQAVLTRWSSNHSRREQDRTELGRAQDAGDRSLPANDPDSSPFGPAIMGSPDGRYIFDALASARKLLGVLADMSPEELCPLPSRYLLYGVYAAVLLYKADFAGALIHQKDREEADALVAKFTDVLITTGANDLHVAREYGRMLQRVWRRKDKRATAGAHSRHTPTYLESRSQMAGLSTEDPFQNGFQASSITTQVPASFGFTTPQLADSDSGLVDLQMLEGFWTQDFSDLLDPFQMYA